MRAGHAVSVWPCCCRIASGVGGARHALGASWAFRDAEVARLGSRGSVVERYWEDMSTAFLV